MRNCVNLPDGQGSFAISALVLAWSCARGLSTEMQKVRINKIDKREHCFVQPKEEKRHRMRRYSTAAYSQGATEGYNR